CDRLLYAGHCGGSLPGGSSDHFQSRRRRRGWQSRHRDGRPPGIGQELQTFMRTLKVTAAMLRGMKERGERIASLTAYDFPTARLLDEVGIPLILVGDSLGMVVL